MPDLEAFFKSLEKKLKGLDRQKDNEEYLQIVKENAKEIREKVLKYLMVRRTRTEIIKYFGNDLRKENLKFPEIANPEPLYYELNEHEDEIFNETITLSRKNLNTPAILRFSITKDGLDQLEEQSQTNMGKFMKILLVKRLESSFFAFQNSIDRFIHSYQMFITEFEKGNVYISKKHTNKIFELLENDDDDAIQRIDRRRKSRKTPQQRI